MTIGFYFRRPSGIDFVNTGGRANIHLANPARGAALTICNKPFIATKVDLSRRVCSRCTRLLRIGPNPKGSIRSVQKRGKSAQHGDCNA